MANVLTFTEAFDNAAWNVVNGLTITPNVAAAPSTAAPGAGLADQLTDPGGGGVARVAQDPAVAPDGSAWIASVYIKKDTDTTRFPELRAIFNPVGGTLVVGAVRLNTQTGAIADAPDWPPSGSGVDTIDANWWRLWVKVINNTNTTAEVNIRPAQTDTINGAENFGTTGSIIAWGANFTNTATLQPYEPQPDYRTLLWFPQGVAVGCAPDSLIASGMGN